MIYQPSFKEIQNLSKDYAAVPVSCELFSDIKTPIQVLKVLKSISTKCYLLESVEGGEQWSRYSFLGYDPIVELRCKDGELELKSGTTLRMKTNDPAEQIRRILEEYKSPQLPFLPSFTGGFVGYFSYDYIKYVEPTLELVSEDDTRFYDVELMLFDKVIAFDHLRKKMILIVNIKTGEDVQENYNKALAQLQSLASTIKNGVASEVPAQKNKLLSPVHALFSKEEYCGMVEKAKKHIFEGDIFQVVLSNRLEAEFQGDLLNTYRVLRTTNPSPYMVYLKSSDVEITSTSPETLVKLHNGKVSTFPIAGTKPRGKTREEDEALMEELRHDEKELSEHNMLVDLGRNDLGKISRFGSVQVKDHMQLQKYSHVIHMTSTVEGVAAQGKDQLDAVHATLPAGTLSGAPKIRACQIIDELENNRRGVYGGAIGYIDFTGNMDVCIAIRMVVKKQDKIYIRSGAGIVADSDPETEYQESLNKAQAVVNAIMESQEVEEL